MAGISYRARRHLRYKVKRSRQDSLPYVSVIFLLAIAVLATQYGNNFITHKSPNIDQNSLLNVATVRAGSSDYGDLCTSDNIFSNRLSLLFLIPLVIFAFIGLAIVTDEYFVTALEKICEQLDLSEDVAGATFMAAGSSTPEFFISLLGVFITEDEVGLGTIVGSAVFNILVIIGLSAALAGSTLDLDWRPLARDSFFYISSIIVLLIFILPVTKGQIDWWEGLILVSCYIIYVLFMAFGNKSYMKFTARWKRDLSRADIESGDMTNTIEQSPEIIPQEGVPIEQPALAEKRNYSELTPRAKLRPASRFRAAQYAVIAAHRLASSSSSGSDDGLSPVTAERKLLGIALPKTFIGWIFFPATLIWNILFKYTIVNCGEERWARLWPLTFIASILWISGISYGMVQAVRVSGCLIGIPATAMGLTVLAAGTSVPDALASIAVARNGAGDMAVSNAIGSNVFDILLGLGFPWFIGGLIKKKTFPVTIDPVAAVIVPIITLFVIIVALVLLLILLKWKLSAKLGYTLFAIYGVFVLYTILDVYVFKLSV